MAIRKKRTTPTKRTTRRRRTTSIMKKVAPRRVTRRKKSMLSEFFSPGMAQSGGKIVISGALGGVGAGLLNKFMPASIGAEMKALYILGAGFVTATVLKAPNVGAGMAGVAVSNLFNAKGFLSEDSSFDYADNLDSLPMVLNEDQAMFLSETDDYFLSEDFSLSEDNMNSYDVGYFSDFGGI